MRRNYFLNIILLLIILPNANYVTAINAISPINASQQDCINILISYNSIIWQMRL